MTTDARSGSPSHPTILPLAHGYAAHRVWTLATPSRDPAALLPRTAALLLRPPSFRRPPAVPDVDPCARHELHYCRFCLNMAVG